jgi:hypothetical protein
MQVTFQSAFDLKELTATLINLMFKSLCQSTSEKPKSKLSIEIDCCFVPGQSVSLTALTPLALNLSIRNSQLPSDPLPAQIQTDHERSKGIPKIGRPFMSEQRRKSLQPHEENYVKKEDR